MGKSAAEQADHHARGPAGAHGVQSVARALAVLRVVAASQDAGVRLVDICRMTALPRPTVHRLLQVLVEETAVEQDGTTRRYCAGAELSLLGLARHVRLPVRSAADGCLRSLAERIGDTVFLSIRHGCDSVCVERVLGSHPIQILAIGVGARRPLGASVSGTVLLAALPPDEAAGVTQHNAERLALAGRSVVQVLQLVHEARERKFAYSDKGLIPGTAALAAPVRDADGQVAAAISVAAVADRLGPKRLPFVVEVLRQHAAQVTRRLTELRRFEVERKKRAVSRAAPASRRGLTSAPSSSPR